MDKEILELIVELGPNAGTAIHWLIGFHIFKQITIFLLFAFIIIAIYILLKPDEEKEGYKYFYYKICNSFDLSPKKEFDKGEMEYMIKVIKEKNENN